MQRWNAWPTSVLVDELDREVRHGDGNRDRARAKRAHRGRADLAQPLGQQVLGPHRVRAEDDRRAQQVEVELGSRGLLGQGVLDLGLLLRVEEVVRGAGRPFLGHPDRVVAMKAVGGDRGRVDEPLRPGGRRRAHRVQRALDVDLADRLPRPPADDDEGEVDDDVAARERLGQRVLVADVAAAVVELRPAVLGGVEGTARDPDDPGDALVRLEPRDEAEAEGPGGPGDGHGEALRALGHGPNLPARLSGCGSPTSPSPSSPARS